MKDVIEEVDAWTARGDAVMLATVIGVKRSAPCPPGAKMAVNSPRRGCSCSVPSTSPPRTGGRLAHANGRIHEVGV